MEAKLWARSAGASVNAVVETLMGNGSMEDVMEQGVGDAADHLLTATFIGRGLGLNHSYGEEEEGVAKLGEKHFLAGGGG